MHQDLVEATKILDIQLPALEKAAKHSEDTLNNFGELLREKLKKADISSEELEKTDVVIFGSIARGESNVSSDCDYYILQSEASAATTRALEIAAESVLKKLNVPEPGVRGVFGEIVVAAYLYEMIGLQIDSNDNLTSRILLLTESKAVTEGKLHQRTIRNTLERYCADYLPPTGEVDIPVKIPRYLLNDLVRYWRTMAVDFGTKRWRTSKERTNLRRAKLLVTRKMLFAGPLASLLLIPKKIKTNGELVPYLMESLEKPPLAQLASTVKLLSEDSINALGKLLVNYDEFIKLVSSEVERKVLGGDGNETERSRILAKCKDITDIIQESLETIFFEDELFKENTQKYCVF